jgi:hypothetical protein
MVAGPSDYVHQPVVTEEQGRREDWLSDSLLSGFVATIAMSVALAGAYGLANMLGDQTGNRVEQWLYALSHNEITDRANDSLVLAIGLNLILGLVFALIYGLIEHRLPGRAGWQRGMIFSLIPFVISIVFFFPIMDGGILGGDLDAGPLPIIGNLILHLIYGAILGSLYAVSVDAWLDGSREDHLTALDMQRDTMLGVLGGAVVGFIAGALLRGQFDSIMNESMTMLIGALVGAAFGGLIGSIMTEEHHDRTPPDTH